MVEVDSELQRVRAALCGDLTHRLLRLHKVQRLGCLLM
jgi:hypothetical protein